MCSRRQRQIELVCSSKCVREEERGRWKKGRESQGLFVRVVVAMVMCVFLCLVVVFLAFCACEKICLQSIRHQKIFLRTIVPCVVIVNGVFFVYKVSSISRTVCVHVIDCLSVHVPFQFAKF